MTLAMRVAREVTVTVLAAAVGISTGVHAANTGFNQTATGTYDYNAGGNWVGGIINGIWDTSLTLGGNQTITFAGDTALTNGLSLKNLGSYSLTFQPPAAGTVKITLQGSLILDPAYTPTTTFGDAANSKVLNVDLGGVTRVFRSKSGANLKFQNTLTNGDIDYTSITRATVGGGRLQLVGAYANAQNSKLAMHGGTIEINEGATGNAPDRAKSLHLQTAVLYVYPGSLARNTTTTLGGPLILDASLGGLPYAGFNGKTAASYTATFSVSSLVRTNDAVVLLRGSNLGTGTGNADQKFLATTSPDLIGGGGGAGSFNISIIPWAVGTPTETGNGSGDTFVTYGANGIRLLDTTTEFESYASGYSGVVNGTNRNVRIPAGATVTFTGNNQVNSLLFPKPTSTVDATLQGDGGTLTVISGAIFLGAYNTPSSTATITGLTLDFGAAQGVVGATSGKNSAIAAPIAGSGGLVVYNNMMSPGASGIQFTSASSTYTGDTVVIGRANFVSGALPSGLRTGNLIVYGEAAFINATSGILINGLSGSGDAAKVYVYGNRTLTIGDNHANGVFGGVIDDANTLAVAKTGGGTQRLGGACIYLGTTTVNGGTLAIDGSIASAATVNTGATLSGGGTITKAGTAVTVNDGGTVDPGLATGVGTLTVAGNVVFASSGAVFHADASGATSDLLSVSGTVSGGPVLVTATVSGPGPWKVISASGGITADFDGKASGVDVYKDNGDTELWVKRVAGGTFLTIR
jgi:fibronectin-binding autotransporter adhesin